MSNLGYVSIQLYGKKLKERAYQSAKCKCKYQLIKYNESNKMHLYQCQRIKSSKDKVIIQATFYSKKLVKLKILLKLGKWETKS